MEVEMNKYVIKFEDGKSVTVSAKAKQNLYEFVINKVAPSLKTTLTDAGIEFTKSSDNDDKFELSLLIGINGTIFEIDSDFAVAMNDTGLYAIGVPIEPLHSYV